MTTPTPHFPDEMGVFSVPKRRKGRMETAERQCKTAVKGLPYWRESKQWRRYDD